MAMGLCHDCTAPALSYKRPFFWQMLCCKNNHNGFRWQRVKDKPKHNVLSHAAMSGMAEFSRQGRKPRQTPQWITGLLPTPVGQTLKYPRVMDTAPHLTGHSSPLCGTMNLPPAGKQRQLPHVLYWRWGKTMPFTSHLLGCGINVTHY